MGRGARLRQYGRLPVGVVAQVLNGAVAQVSGSYQLTAPWLLKCA